MSDVGVRWDESQMRRLYANVCNVMSSREEVVLLFGTSQAPLGGEAELAVQLTDRVILSPLTAKHLYDMLQDVLREYEARFGALPDPRVTP
jgi:hypothetical protein